MSIVRRITNLKANIKEAMDKDISMMSVDEVYAHYETILRMCGTLTDMCVRNKDHTSVHNLMKVVVAIRKEMHANIDSIVQFENIRPELEEEAKQLKLQEEEKQKQEMLDKQQQEKAILCDKFVEQIGSLILHILSKKQESTIPEITKIINLIDVTVSFIKFYKKKITTKQQLREYIATFDPQVLKLILEHANMLKCI